MKSKLAGDGLKYWWRLQFQNMAESVGVDTPHVKGPHTPEYVPNSSNSESQEDFSYSLFFLESVNCLRISINETTSNSFSA